MAEFTSEEVKQNLYSSLKELGLSDVEIELYAVSLALGPSPIAKIAEHLKLARPNVYKVISGLEQHGLAKFSELKKYSRNFVVEPPTVVLEKLRQKREAVSQLDTALVSNMPDLLALYHRGATPTKIRVLEGREEFLKTSELILEEARDRIEFFGSLADFVAFTSWEEQERLIKRRRAKAIRVHALVLPSDAANLIKANDAKENRETRILRGAAPFVISFQIFANKVILWQPKTPLAVLIEDEYIVEMLRSVFYKLWETSAEGK